jgi:PKD repeat protein
MALAAGPNTLNLRVLLIGDGNASPETGAWAAALTSEGVPYTEVDTTGTAPAEMVNLPILSTGTTGNFNAVVISGSPTDFAVGQLTALDAYESSYGVRQLDGYMFPDPNLGVTAATSGALDGTTGTLTSAGLTAFPELKGTIPFDTGSFGYGGTVTGGTAYTPLITETFPAGTYPVAGVYQHPSTDPQAGVQELALNFDYNANQLHWWVLAPGLINWVTQDTHLGLYRSYFGQDIDDVFIADNEWSSALQCTPAASNPPDFTCPPADQGLTQGVGNAPPDVQMNALDVAYVAGWEQQTGIKLNLAFNAIGACTAPTTAAESSAICDSRASVTDPGGTYTDPGQVVDSSYPNDQGMVNALLADQGDFNWITHTWSHQFLGCTVWQPQALTSVTANTSGGTFTAGSYSYEITAATAYGESEPSIPQTASVGTDGSVTLNWSEATNGTGTDGTPGPTLFQLQSAFGGGTGFWGYNVYRAPTGSTNYGLVGQVPETANATLSTTYNFTDTGSTAGPAPDSSTAFPSATNPGIDCSSTPGSWDPATSTAADSSIEQEIGMDQAFAAANGLTNYTPAAVVTGEHSGLENPNMTTALVGTGVTTFAQDGSRQPTQYSLGAALGAPRYPSNIYYNASTWADEINEYNTLYAAPSVSIGNGEFGRCTNTSATTCITTAATQDSILASESRIMLGHVLNNNPRVGYAHQSNLIGPDYTILTLISDMLSQYNSWFNSTAPLVQMTDTAEAPILQEQGAWTKAEGGTGISASITNGVVTVANSGSQVSVPVTVPAGTMVNGAAFGQAYGGTLSDWVPVGTAPVVLNEPGAAPVITSGATATSIVGAAFSYTITTTGTPTPAITETGALPTGLTFTDNGNGTATIAGTSAAATGGSYPITITAADGASPNATQAFTLTNAEAPTITSAGTAAFSTGVAGTYTVTTTGFPAPTITETGALPTDVTLVDNGNGTATLAGTPAAGTEGTYPVTISATNASGSTATLSLTITVTTAAAPAFTTGSSAFFNLGQSGGFAVTASGSPVPTITLTTGTLPAGLSLVNNGSGSVLIQGTPTATGTVNLTFTASNGVSPNATQNFTLVVQAPPAFTSNNAVTFNANDPTSSFTVTTSGYPPPSIGWDSQPPGMTFTDNGNGTATLSGTPTMPGSYPVTLTATNSGGSLQQTLTVTVQAAPAVTSVNAATFTSGTAGSFTVMTTGGPTPAISTTSTLPAGVTLTDNGNGTATLASTAATAAGSYPITITAANGISPNATQSFTLTVNPGPAAPAITSANTAAFTAGTAGSFTVTTTGNPAAAISTTSTLPAGVTLTDNGNGTATLASTAATAAGSYPITITAANGVSPNATQNFTLTVNPVAPVFTSASGTTFAVGTAGTFSVTTTGNPNAALSATSSPALPSGVTLKDNGDGTATLSGTPPAGSQGTYALTIKATNSGGTATQSFVLTVNSGLAITSAATASATSGSPFTFTVTTVGTPSPTISRAGTLPPGISFTANANGTATLSGTPTAAARGPYPITFTARNSTGTASQAFVLTVNNAPAFSSAATATETSGTAFTFTVNTTGYPTAALSATGLPTGVSLSDSGNGTGSLSGTTAVAAGTYPITLTAKNAGGTTTQAFTLTVRAPGTVAVPTFTSPAAAAAVAGTAFSFTVTTVGSPTTYTTNVTRSGTLPAGISFTNNGNGTATLTGTPTATSGGTYPLTFTARNTGGTTTQSFVLTVSAKPTISTAATAIATDGSTFSFTVKATGAPTPTLAESGGLPQGLTWTDNGNGTATLAGTPGVNQGGVYPLTFTAANAAGTTTQTFTLTVRQAPAITSASSATATHGVAGFSFTFTATGYPVPNVTHTGAVPGLTYTNLGNGTARLAGTPRTAGTYTLTITATNNNGTAIQTFTLTVK